jgi:hypothetical protein
MLAICLLAVGALGADTEAPVISLQFADVPQLNPVFPHDGHSNSSSLHDGVVNRHSTLTDQNMYVDQTTLDATSGTTTGASRPLPTATAFDHHDGDISADITAEDVKLYAEQIKCTTAQTAFDITPVGCLVLDTYDADESGSVHTITQAAWNTTALKRAEYIAHWQVRDEAGNDADSVAYSVIVTDVTAPQTTASDTDTVEFSSSDTVSAEITFEDNYDDVIGISAPTIPSGWTTAWVTNGATYTVPACTPVGDDYTVEIDVADSAGIFGTAQASNAGSFTRTVTVSDTTPPTFAITQNARSWECNIDTIPAQLLADFVTQTDTWTSDFYTIEDTVDFAICTDGDLRPSLAQVGASAGNCGQFDTIEDSSSGHTVGTCTTTYQATDAVGLTSATATQTWTVVDTTPPTIAGRHASESNVATISHYHSVTSSVVADKVHPNLHQCNVSRATMNNHFANNLQDDGVSRLSFNNEEIQHSMGDVSGSDLTTMQENLLDLTCSDACTDPDDPSTAVTTAFQWVTTCMDGETPLVSNSKPYDITAAGTYILQYTCKDAVDLISTQCRTVINEDASKPIIDIKCKTDQQATNPDGFGDDVYLPASGEDFVDVGAYCYSYKDGNLNANVQTTGDIVNLAVSATYLITYNCQSNDGDVDADPAVRTVTVTDSCAPSCTFMGVLSESECSDRVANIGNWTEYVEASFPFDNSRRPVCTDESTHLNITAALSGAVDVELTGTYVLTFTATDSSSNEASYFQTVVVEDTLRPSIVLHYDGAELSLMEENHFVNGWLVGAVVSAITGVAMIAYSSKTSVATSVPV